MFSSVKWVYAELLDIHKVVPYVLSKDLQKTFLSSYRNVQCSLDSTRNMFVDLQVIKEVTFIDIGKDVGKNGQIVPSSNKVRFVQ